MDQREHQLQTLGICNRLYNFIMRALTAQALKTVTLGHPVQKNLLKANDGAACESDQLANQGVPEQTPCENVEQAYNVNDSDPFVPLSSPSNGFKQYGRKLLEVEENDAKINEEKIDSYVSPGERPEQEAPLPSLEAIPPKKAVGTNDRVQEIETNKKDDKEEIRRKFDFI